MTESKQTESVSTARNNKFNFCIDRGGTFTDIYCEIPAAYHAANKNCPYFVTKLLSRDGINYEDAPREGIRRVLDRFLGAKSMTSDKKVDSSHIGYIRMGTTVATNALLEREGEPTALIISKGFKDLLRIGNQSRPQIFDLNIKRPELIYSKVYEINERVLFYNDKLDKQTNMRVETTASGQKFLIEKEPSKEEILSILRDIHKNKIESIAIACLHSYAFDKHELLIQSVAQSVQKEFNLKHISLSSQIMPMVKIVPRAHTTCADAYLTPCIKNYIDRFVSGFDANFSSNTRLSFMQSDGGLCLTSNFTGSRAVLSGPAGGVIGYVETTFNAFGKRPVIGFDMGGTSTDVSRYFGELEHVFENTTAGVTIQAPQLDITTVAAGGGSCLTFESGMFKVGPKSAGAVPGPVCYKRTGGMLAVTDANLMLNRIIPEFFPKIFGKNRNETLGRDETKKAFEAMQQRINNYYEEQKEQKEQKKDDVNAKKMDEMRKKTVPEIAMGFVKVANEAMCRPIRAITEARGYDAAQHVLSCFGGAGGQHACAIARSLKIHKVMVHRFAGILSAYGMGLADVVNEEQVSFGNELTTQGMQEVQKVLAELESKCLDRLGKDGFERKQIEVKPYLNLRFRGSDTALFIPGPFEFGAKEANDLSKVYDGYKQEFLKRYKREYGFVLERDILVDDIRVRGIANLSTNQSFSIPTRPSDSYGLKPILSDWQAWFEEPGQGLKCMKTPVYSYDDLYFGDIVSGPCLIQQDTSTIVIEPECTAEVDAHGSIIITINDALPVPVTEQLDDIQLSIFGHRFMSIAEQMGRTLQRTSVSTNIKERLDFSCAIFGPTGDLVANAPHLPVHLGSMQEAVRHQIKTFGSNIFEGDVLVSNHPCAGGTHLPDITVMTPVFDESGGSSSSASGSGSGNESKKSPVFWVASRGHHADIGGIAPGSMPPFSTVLSEEGAAIEGMKLVTAGKFNEHEISDILKNPTPEQLKNKDCVGTRNLSDNLSDLRAQVAANQKGIGLMKALIKEYCLKVVQAYMYHIQNNAEQAVRNKLKEIAKQYGSGKTDVAAKEVERKRGSSIVAIEELYNPGDASDAGGSGDKNSESKDAMDGVMQNIQSDLGFETTPVVDELDVSPAKKHTETKSRDEVNHSAIKTQSSLSNVCTLSAIDFMDDGTPIKVSIKINPSNGSAVFDFEGTGAMVFGNCNAPPSVTFSAIIYCLRCLVHMDIPLNQGCLKPITVKIPSNSILFPSREAAVVGGNVLTSQRVTDVILKAFEACAASQGCMNNLTFGDATFGYYETIAGGSGAGPEWHGVSGVHTHMTNTRITDPEVLERRYPVILRQFGLRNNSGGKGKFKGGEGCVRSIEFRKDLFVSVLTERRSYKPYGLKGGEDAKSGVNLIRRANDSVVFNLGSKRTYHAKAGDIIHIITPGGGGYGELSET